VEADFSEPDCIRAAKNGDRGAYDKLVRKYQKQVYRWAYQLVRAHDLADEVSQEVFVRTYGALDRIDPDRPLGAWLCRSTTNIAFNILRKHQFRTRWAEENRAGAMEIEQPPPQPDAEFHSRRIAERVQKAVDALPPAFRAVILLRVKEEMTYEEIADALGISLGTVMSRLARARRKLRMGLADLLKEFKG
jgi:RNA polymerase sigma-70 factor (ECF subfamily)